MKESERKAPGGIYSPVTDGSQKPAAPPERKHTPLPWEIDGGAYLADSVGISSPLRRVCAVNNGTKQATANAAFIVKACNSHYKLQNALAKLLAAVESNRQFDTIEGDDLIGDCRDALSAAGLRIICEDCGERFTPSEGVQITDDMYCEDCTTEALARDEVAARIAARNVLSAAE